MIDPPDLAAGDPITFDWLNAVKNMARRAKTIIAPGSDLFSRETSDGNVVGLSLPPGAYHAVVTQVVQLASGLTLGSGQATLYYEQFDQNQVGTLVPITGDITIYFAAPSGGSTTSIAVGQRVIVLRTASGRYSVCTGYC